MGLGDGAAICNVGGGCQGELSKAADYVTGITLGSPGIGNT